MVDLVDRLKKYRLVPLIIPFSLWLVLLLGCNMDKKEGSEPTVQSPDQSPGTTSLEINEKGLIVAPGVELVSAHCTICHSAQLVTQNRLSRSQWKATIRWMQETQNLWELGEAESVIIDYLVENYPIVEKGRRAPLAPVEWYDFKD